MGSEAVQTLHIVREDGICGGQPRIAGTRLKVQHIAFEYERLGRTPDQICDAHPGITLAQIHAALSYYFEHKEEIDRAIREDEEFAERLRPGLG